MFLAIIILQSGRYSYVQDNGHTNFGPSGTSAFLELLKQSGYKVQVETGRSPKLAPIMIVPVSELHKKEFSNFLKGIKSATTVIAFAIPPEEGKSKGPQKITHAATDKPVGEMEPVSVESATWQKPQIEDAEKVSILTSANGGATIAEAVSKNDIRLIQLIDAACITNRYIDTVNNASIAMGLVAMSAKKGDAVTFLGSFCSRQSEDSLLAKMGAPFQAAWSQVLLLVLVIFLTLSVRFGLAPESRARQRGGRELVDGLAWMTRRKKNARWALRAVFDRVLAELERRHRIGREEIIRRPDLYLTSEAAVILKDVEAATMQDITEQDAIRYAKALKGLV